MLDHRPTPEYDILTPETVSVVALPEDRSSDDVALPDWALAVHDRRSEVPEVSYFGYCPCEPSSLDVESLDNGPSECSSPIAPPDGGLRWRTCLAAVAANGHCRVYCGRWRARWLGARSPLATQSGSVGRALLIVWT